MLLLVDHGLLGLLRLERRSSLVLLLVDHGSVGLLRLERRSLVVLLVDHGSVDLLRFESRSLVLLLVVLLGSAVSLLRLVRRLLAPHRRPRLGSRSAPP